MDFRVGRVYAGADGLACLARDHPFVWTILSGRVICGIVLHVGMASGVGRFFRHGNSSVRGPGIAVCGPLSGVRGAGKVPVGFRGL